jgi:hypothetical protein
MSQFYKITAHLCITVYIYIWAIINASLSIDNKHYREKSEKKVKDTYMHPQILDKSLFSFYYFIFIIIFFLIFKKFI